MSDEKIYKTLSLQALEAEQDRMRELYELHPSNCEHPDMFGVLEGSDHLDLYWGNFEYSVPLTDISTPEGLLWLLHHVLDKDWEEATPLRVHRLIEFVAWLNKWDMYRRLDAGPEPRTTADAAERAKLTPKLRYDVLMRDNFRCRSCGAGPEHGAHLHIDHIKPISKGGTTEFPNLQALCSMCNHGKGARS